MSSAPAALCVLCRRKQVDPAHRPFCSARCRLLDLARWADGDYRMAGESLAPDPAGEDDGDQQP